MVSPALRVLLDQVALREGATPIGLSLYAGQSALITGRPGAGKSALIEVITARAQPASGNVLVSGTMTETEVHVKHKRLTAEHLAKLDRQAHPDRVAEALTATQLWNERKTVISKLSPGQQVAASLLPVLASPADILFFDGSLDALDPWVRADVLALLERRKTMGACWVAVSYLADVAAACDWIVVLKEGSCRFVGTLGELIQRAGPSRLEAEAEQMADVLAMVHPFEVSVRESQGVARFEALEGQQLAARLLTHGYGNVKFVILREPTFAEALMALG